MTASSITGKGSGSSVNLYKNTNRIITEPKILYAGIVRTDDQVPESSPPSETGYATVIFPKPLVGLGEEHVVVATTLNGGRNCFKKVVKCQKILERNFTKELYNVRKSCKSHKR
jgi:hypothetical protein